MLYHGSEKKIEKPLFGFGKTDNDYGRGFYCTQDKELAKEWACQKDKDGFVNSYEIDLSNLKILELNNDNFSILHWLCILIENREVDNLENDEAIEFLKKNYHINTDDYDIITGYRADDSYFTFARDFINDAITIQSLERAMKLGTLGIQFMIKSEKAFNSLTFKNSELVSSVEYFAKFNERDTNARKTYKELRKQPKSSGFIITEIVKNPKLIDSINK